MSADSHTSVSSPAAPTAVPRLSAFVKRAFAGIDLPSLQLASKTSLAIVLALGIAFWMDLSATITAVTALMIQQGYVGATMKRGLLRLAGGSAGAVFGLVLLASFGQDRALFIGSVALCVGAIAYFMQAARNWYAYILTVASMVLVGYGNVEHPQYAFQFSVTWVSGILVAIVIVSLVHGLLWPTTTAKVFEGQLRENLDNCRTLLRLMIETLVEGRDRSAELHGTEQKIIHGLPELRATLQTAAIDSWQIEKYEDSYERLLGRVTSLARRVIEVDEHLKICRTQPAVADAVRQSETLRQIAHQLDGQLRSLIDALAEARDGTRLPDLDQERGKLDLLVARVGDELDAAEADVFDKGALIGLHEKLRQLATDVSEMREALANVETAASLTAARAAAKQHQHDVPPLAPRVLKSARASLVMIAVPCVWIWTNWPMALNRLMLYSGVLACLSCLLPAIPRRAILAAIGAGAAGGALLYFGILRPLDGYLELGLVMFFAALPYCYLMNSPRPTAMLAGLFGGMIMLGLIDLSLVQNYSFSKYANNLIGYGGGFIVGMIVLQLFATSTPEQTFCRRMQAFFNTCGQTVNALSATLPSTDRGKAVLATQTAALLKAHSMCRLWSRIIDPRRAPHNEPKKVDGVLASMQSLVFRIEITEQARLQIPDEVPFAALMAAERGLRTSFGASLRAIQGTIDGHVLANALPDTRAKIEEYRRQLEALRDNPAVERMDRRIAGQVLVLAGYYRALADAIEQCHEDAKALDWQSWERSYI